MRVAILLHFCFLFLPAFPGIVLGQNQVSVQDRGLTAVNTRTPFKGKQTGVSINRSFPEDITSENYLILSKVLCFQMRSFPVSLKP